MVLVDQLPPPVVSELHARQLIDEGVQQGRLSGARLPHDQKSEILDGLQLLAPVVEERQSLLVQPHAHALAPFGLRLRGLR